MKKTISVFVGVLLALASYYFDFRDRCIDPGIGHSCYSTHIKFYGLLIGYLITVGIAGLAFKIRQKNYYLTVTVIFISLAMGFLVLNYWLERLI